MPTSLQRLLVLSLLLIAASSHAADRPNIIIIMGDDMGYSDIGCYGGEINTPTLNSLAENGLRFTQFYNTARCCPTRAALLTGLYPHQAGVGHMMEDRGHDGYRGNLNNQCVTIAEALGAAGYRNYMSGKWHVTRHTDPKGPSFNWPRQRGFDRFYGTIHGAGSFFDPNTLMRDNTMISPYADPEYKPKQYYYTDAISDHAVRFVNEHCKDHTDKPFFMYVAYTAAHWPMHALPHDIAKYKGKYDKGYTAIRKARFERMRKLGLSKEEWKMSPQAEDWDSVKNREWEIACMEVYAAMVDSMDQGIGRIVESLKQNKQLDNTLIMYLQDNGGCAEGLGRRPRNNQTKRADKPTLPPMDLKALQPNMIPNQTRDGYPVIMGPGIMPGPADTYIAYGRGWANVSNTPFREYKHWVHEGGISTPLVAHWPAGIKRRSELENQPGHLVDLMATCVDVAGAKYPKDHKGHKIKPMEGRSLAPAFTGGQIERDAIYWEHEGNRAVRVDNWKLVAKGSRGAWELYNLAADRSEMTNLASKMPEKVKELTAKWQAYAERANVLPLNPRNEKKVKFSKKKKFTLKQGDSLPQNKAPYVKGKPFTISATVKAESPNGVIVAQGGTAHGYSLYLREGKLTFATRLSGKLTTVSTESNFPEAAAKVIASLATDGTVTLAVDGKQSTFKTPGLLVDMPIDGLQVGRDENGEVGDYKVPNPLKGTIEKLMIKID